MCCFDGCVCWVDVFWYFCFKSIMLWMNVMFKLLERFFDIGIIICFLEFGGCCVFVRM